MVNAANSLKALKEGKYKKKILNIYYHQNYVRILFLTFPLSIVWFSSCLAETNLSPLYFAEDESELVSRFNVEYLACHTVACNEGSLSRVDKLIRNLKKKVLAVCKACLKTIILRDTVIRKH